MLESYLKSIVTIDGITGCIAVNTQDGSVLLQEGDINPSLEDITAFFGSGFDVVASSLGVRGLKFSCLEKENQKVIILVKEDVYIGCELSDNTSSEVITKRILEIERPVEEEKEPEKFPVTPESEMSQASRFFKSKIRQINLLIDEFSQGIDKAQWIRIIKEKFSENEIGEKLMKVIRLEDDKAIFLGNLDPDLREEDISAVSKLVTDALCRKAVEKYEAIEAKKKVHSVIEKLGIAK